VKVARKYSIAKFELVHIIIEGKALPTTKKPYRFGKAFLWLLVSLPVLPEIMVKEEMPVILSIPLIKVVQVMPVLPVLVVTCEHIVFL